MLQDEEKEITAAGLVVEWRSGRSFRARRPGTKGREFSLCTSTKGRCEAKYLSESWHQAPDIELVLAEFGPEPFLAFSSEYLKFLDCYVYAHCPWSSPFAPSWWKNVPAYSSTGKYVLHVDCDIAVSPSFFDWAKEWIRDGVVLWPREISGSKITVAKPVKFHEIKSKVGEVNYERVFCWSASDMRSLGGWPEWYTGRRHTWILLKHQIRKLNTQSMCPINFFCHVPPLKMADSYSDERSRSPIWKTNLRSFWTPESCGWDPAPYNAEWPINGWEPGQPDLYERFMGDQINCNASPKS